MENIELKQSVNLTLSKAKKVANDYIKENLLFINGFIYVNCKNVSDLFIVKNKEIRSCTSNEWNEYFYSYLQPRETNTLTK